MLPSEIQSVDGPFLSVQTVHEPLNCSSFLQPAALTCVSLFHKHPRSSLFFPNGWIAKGECHSGNPPEHILCFCLQDKMNTNYPAHYFYSDCLDWHSEFPCISISFSFGNYTQRLVTLRKAEISYLGCQMNLWQCFHWCTQVMKLSYNSPINSFN